MTSPLTTHNAEITTATVQIKTLTVNGKQVTQALFRQLPEASLVADDGTLNGTPWGTVNYHPDGRRCADAGDHLHVVWQIGTELRRARVEPVPVFDQEELRENRNGFRAPELDRFLTAEIREWAYGRLADHPLTRYPRADKFPIAENFILVEAATPFVATASHAALDVASGWDWAEPGEDLRASVSAHACERLDREVTGWGLPYSQILEDYDAVVQTEQQRRQRHRDAHTELAALPQLFIAV